MFWPTELISSLNHIADNFVIELVIEARVAINIQALFALNNPLNKGVILADEVGLGKTIEAGLVLCQYWAERKRQLLIICPASLRKQWAQELQDKFNLPSQILDANTWRQLKNQGIANPLNNHRINILSYHFAARLEESLVVEPWNLVVMDEAHRLRNAYRPNNKMGQALKRALYGRQLESKLNQKTEVEDLFIIRWRL